MKNEKFMEFLSKAVKDENFKVEAKKFNKKAATNKLTQEDSKNFVNNVILPKAKKLGYIFTEADLVELGKSQEFADLAKLSPEDLENVNGGMKELFVWLGATIVGLFGGGGQAEQPNMPPELSHSVIQGSPEMNSSIDTSNNYLFFEKQYSAVWSRLYKILSNLNEEEAGVRVGTCYVFRTTAYIMAELMNEYGMHLENVPQDDNALKDKILDFVPDALVEAQRKGKGQYRDVGLPPENINGVWRRVYWAIAKRVVTEPSLKEKLRNSLANGIIMVMNNFVFNDNLSLFDKVDIDNPEMFDWEEAVQQIPLNDLIRLCGDPKEP